MALTRLYSFLPSTLSIPQAAGEFDNIYNNALTLISPLTGDLAAGGYRITGLSAGSLASPSLQFTGDGNTGVYSPAAEQFAIVVAGVAAANFTTGAVGPHVIGSGTTNADAGLLITGTGAAGQAMGVQIASTTTPATTESSYGLNVVPTLTEFSAGLHPNLAGINVEPTVTAGAGTLTTLAGIRTGALTAQTGTTNATALYISAVPTGATNNYALWAADGAFRFDSVGPHIIGGTSALLGGTLQIMATEGSLGLLKSTNPGVTTTETFLAMYGYTSTGALIKTASISSVFADTANAAGYSVLRLNSTYQVAGVQTDENSIALFGGNGVYFWAPAYGTANAPGNKVVRIDGTVSVNMASNSRVQVGLGGSFSPGATGLTRALDVGTTLNPGAGDDAYGIYVQSLLTEAGSGVHALLSGVTIEPAISNAGATVTTAAGLTTKTFAAGAGTTNAAGIYVAAAPTGATNNYALWVDAGTVRLDATTANGTVATAMSNLGPVGSNTTIQEWLTININGTTRYIPCF